MLPHSCVRVRTVKVCRRLLLLLIPVVPGLVVMAGPAPMTPPIATLQGGEKLDALIERVVERQRAIRTLKADFVQVKTSDMLLEAVESSGVFMFRAPDLVRWDYDRPDPMVVLFAGDTVTTFHPRQLRAERIKVSGKQRRFVRVLAGTQPLDDLTSNFAVTLSDPGGDKPYRLKLRPATAMLKKKLRSVEIEIDRTLFLPVVVEYDETDGDNTRYEFNNLVIDSPIDDSRFRLDLGPDVRVQTLDASSGVG